MSDFSIERATEDILGGVAELEKLCFSFPWSKKALELLCADKNVAFVAKDVNSGKVVAYGGMLSVVDEGQITNVSTHPDFRRRGLGLKIVSALIDYARNNGLVSISLEVRQSNFAAIELSQFVNSTIYFKKNKRKYLQALAFDSGAIYIICIEILVTLWYNLH